MRKLPILMGLGLFFFFGFIAVQRGGESEAIATGSWGLSFPREGEAPTGNASAVRRLQ